MKKIIKAALWRNLIYHSDAVGDPKVLFFIFRVPCQPTCCRTGSGRDDDYLCGRWLPKLKFFILVALSEGRGTGGALSGSFFTIIYATSIWRGSFSGGDQGFAFTDNDHSSSIPVFTVAPLQSVQCALLIEGFLRDWSGLMNLHYVWVIDGLQGWFFSRIFKICLFISQTTQNQTENSFHATCIHELKTLMVDSGFGTHW